LNLTKGCVHHCAFCSIRAAATYVGDDVVYLYADTAKRVREELADPDKRPRAVYICPATDPFPPIAEIQAETTRVIAVLAEMGVDSWLMTRGYVRPAAGRVLETYRERVKVTMGLTTLDRRLQGFLEPLAAPPRLRLKQLARLRELGVSVQVAFEPLLPGLTDTRANLTALLDAVASVGVRQVTAGYMFLRAGLRENLMAALDAFGVTEAITHAYQHGPVLSSGSIPPAKYLPKVQRQRGYAALMALAAEFGITVRISGTTNPDFRSQRRQPDMHRSSLPLFSSIFN
jgi:DNA repair photolyase